MATQNYHNNTQDPIDNIGAKSAKAAMPVRPMRDPTGWPRGATVDDYADSRSASPPVTRPGEFVTQRGIPTDPPDGDPALERLRTQGLRSDDEWQTRKISDVGTEPVSHGMKSANSGGAPSGRIDKNLSSGDLSASALNPGFAQRRDAYDHLTNPTGFVETNKHPSEQWPPKRK